MQARWHVRQAVRQLSGFLQGGCFASGASIDSLFAAEQRLGAPLPWQVYTPVLAQEHGTYTRPFAVQRTTRFPHSLHV